MYGFSGTSKEREHVISEVMTSKDKKKKNSITFKGIPNKIEFGFSLKSPTTI